MTGLFDAFRRVATKEQGMVFIDGYEAYRHWLEPDDIINWETKGTEDVAFRDQQVRFDSRGFTQAADIHGRDHEVRILVLVPFGPTLQTYELICPPERASD